MMTVCGSTTTAGKESPAAGGHLCGWSANLFSTKIKSRSDTLPAVRQHQTSKCQLYRAWESQCCWLAVLLSSAKRCSHCKHYWREECLRMMVVPASRANVGRECANTSLKEVMLVLIYGWVSYAKSKCVQTFIRSLQMSHDIMEKCGQQAAIEPSGLTICLRIKRCCI